MKTLASWESADGFSWSVALEWKPADCWVGVFWQPGVLSIAGKDPTDEWPPQGGMVNIWICPVPCLPIHLILRWLP